MLHTIPFQSPSANRTTRSQGYIEQHIPRHGTLPEWSIIFLKDSIFKVKYPSTLFRIRTCSYVQSTPTRQSPLLLNSIGSIISLHLLLCAYSDNIVRCFFIINCCEPLSVPADVPVIHFFGFPFSHVFPSSCIPVPSHAGHFFADMLDVWLTPLS